MTDTIKHSFKERIGIIAAVLAILSLTIITTLVKPVDASTSIVTVFADNQERVISTSVETVGEALERADVELSEDDLVEPAIDTDINQKIFRINVYRARPVTVVDEDGSQATVMSPYTSPRLIAEGAGFDVYDEDIFNFELIDDILATGSIGQRLLIDRAVPVTINLYGDTIEHRTHVSTVEEALAEAGVVVGDEDTLTPKPSTQIKQGQSIKIVRIGTDVVVEEKPIKFDTEFVYDQNRYEGEEEVKTTGVNGIKVITYELTLENGNEKSRKELQSVVKKDPTTEVRIIGSKKKELPTISVSGDKQAWLAASGIPQDQWAYVDSIVQRESGWNPNAVNSSSGACGLGQQLPCGKWAGAWNDPVAALQAMNGYVNGRYGSWQGAVSFWQVNHWY